MPRQIIVKVVDSKRQFQKPVIPSSNVKLELPKTTTKRVTVSEPKPEPAPQEPEPEVESDVEPEPDEKPAPLFTLPADGMVDPWEDGSSDEEFGKIFIHVIYCGTSV